MSHKVSFRSAFQRDFKKLPASVQNFVLDIADRVQKGEVEGEKLKGSFRDFHKVSFGRKPEYRLVYRIYNCLIKNSNELKCQFDDIEHTEEELQNCDGLIEYVLIKSREEMNNVYAQSKKQIKNLYR